MIYPQHLLTAQHCQHPSPRKACRRFPALTPALVRHSAAAQAWADERGIPKAYGTYGELLTDDGTPILNILPSPCLDLLCFFCAFYNTK